MTPCASKTALMSLRQSRRLFPSARALLRLALQASERSLSLMTALVKPLNWWKAAASLLPNFSVSFCASKVVPSLAASHVSTLAAPLLQASFNACSRDIDQALMNALSGFGLRISPSVAVSAFFLMLRRLKAEARCCSRIQRFVLPCWLWPVVRSRLLRSLALRGAGG